MQRSGLRIALGCVILAVAYGILHDLVTAHVSLPYFTIHHPKIIESESPVVQALFWGGMATWWMGLGAGILFALVNKLRKDPFEPSVILRKVVIGLAVLMLVPLSTLPSCTVSHPECRLINVGKPSRRTDA